MSSIDTSKFPIKVTGEKDEEEDTSEEDKEEDEEKTKTPTEVNLLF